MKQQAKNVICVLLALNIFAAHNAAAQQAKDNEVVIAFYNCENFFDTVDNPAKADEDFTPQGKYRYTRKIYEQKLHNIASVLQNMDGTDGPAIIGLAEVENSNVLSALVHQPEIARRDYRYLWFDGPDPRGINVALLYNPKHFTVLKSEPLHVDITGISHNAKTRDILHVHGVLNGDTVHVFVNHWPSRRGGEDESGPKRAMAAKVNRAAADRILRMDPNAEIIVMGDLNDNPDDNSIAGILGAKGDPAQASVSGFYDPWLTFYKSGTGTEEYQHKWNLFDQIIISRGFLKDKKHRLSYEKAVIFKPDFIIDHYKGHEGEPKRSFAGSRWINGYSDHFPVLLYFSKN